MYLIELILDKKQKVEEISKKGIFLKNLFLFDPDLKYDKFEHLKTGIDSILYKSASNKLNILTFYLVAKKGLNIKNLLKLKTIAKNVKKEFVKHEEGIRFLTSKCIENQSINIGTNILDLTVVLLNRVDLQRSIVKFLCLSNYSFRNIHFEYQFNIKKIILSNDPKFIKKLKRAHISKKESVFHNVDELNGNFQFENHKFSDLKNHLQNCILHKQMFVLSKERLLQILKIHEISKFQLTIFYDFIKKNEDVSNLKKNVSSASIFLSHLPKGIQNVLIIKAKKDVRLMYNPFNYEA